MDRRDFDVFLSFRGEIRNTFISHLYQALCGEKIKAFIDTEIERGEEITPALERVIEGAKISIIVFSSDYASSTFCLDELVKIMECKELKAQIVLPIFYKVYPSEQSYQEAFARHEDAFQRGWMPALLNLVGWNNRHREETIEEEMKKVERWKSALRKALLLAGWHIVDTSNEAQFIRVITTEVLKKLKCEPTCFERISTPLVGQTAIDYLEKIWEYLMNDETSRVGVYGMGGVGKTTIVTHINNRFLAVPNSFSHIYWVTVSKASDIYKLQNDIAKVIKLEFDGEDDEGKRAAMLWQKLEGSKKFVLILDDMWEALETKDIGIPISADGGKLLLTTRKRQVCQRMKCEQIVKIEPLPEQEAWDLFIKESDYQFDDSPELKEVVESVAKEFAGLPLAAVSVARSMRGVVDISEWRNILYELQKPARRQNDEMEKVVFKALKISYDRLRDEKYRECLLYCCLFPEDYLIERNDLIEYWIGEGIIEELDSRQEEFDKGNAILNELINVCLLEQGTHFIRTNVAFVKMHDVVRDMALTITKVKFMTKVRSRLRDLPKENEWSADLDYVFLMENYELVRCDSNLAPNCSKLRTLLLQSNCKLTKLSSCFFDNMPNLTVLDMRHLKSSELLPDSITKLRNLRVLLLEGWSSRYIPSWALLENLRVLDLSRGTLTEIPSGLEELVNLRVLNLSWNDFSMVLFPTAVLEKLSHLQSLKLEWCHVVVEPNALFSLEKLESLSLTFYDFDRFCSYIKSQNRQTLKEYRISVSPSREFSTSFSDHNNVYQKAMLLYNDIMDSDGAGKADILLPGDIQYLEVRSWDNPLDDILKNRTFSNLQKLVISLSKGMYLFTPDIAKQLLVNVKELNVEWGPYEELITATKEESMIESNHNDYPAIKFQKLKKLRLGLLVSLKSIYRGRIVCPSLEIIEIESCMQLKRLPFYMEKAEEGRQTNPSTVPPSLKQIKGSDLWWNSLQWDHPDDKSVFQPFFVQHEDNPFVARHEVIGIIQEK